MERVIEWALEIFKLLINTRTQNYLRYLYIGQAWKY